MAITRLGPNNSTNISGINLTSQVTGTLPTANGGTGATSFSPGKVLQIVNGSTTTQVGVTASNAADTGLSASITPSATSSKVLIIANHGLFTKSSHTTYCNFHLKRDSLDIYSINNAFYSENDGQLRLPTHSFSFLDSPSTTSATTYLTRISCPSGSSGTIYSQYQNMQSTIQLLEIGA